MPPVMSKVVADVTDKVDVAAMVADELVKAVVGRMIVLGDFRVTLVPFADESRGVAGGFEHLGERDFAQLQSFAMFGVIRPGVNHRFDSGTLLVAARQQACAGG